VVRSILASLLLAVSVSAADFQFDARGVTAIVTPFATTYWSCGGARTPWLENYDDLQAIIEDSDGDGVVRWELGRLQMRVGLFTMIDGTSGSITTRSNTSSEVAPIPFPANAFLRDQNGAVSRFAFNLADLEKQRFWVPLFWVRRGVGAWSGDAGDGGFDELSKTPSKTLLDVRNMTPVGSSPAPPSTVQPGDFFIMQDYVGEFWTGGLVDAHLDEASGGGTILHGTTIGDEDTKKITITLARIDGTDGTVSVHYETQDQSATAGVHYQASAGDVVFQPGQILSSFDVPVIDDANPSYGTFKVNFSAASGATLGVSSINVEVLDNDGTPAVYFPRVDIPEGDGGVKEISYAIKLNHTAPKPVTLQWEIRNRFNPAELVATGSLEFAVGEKEKTIATQYVADDIWSHPLRWSVGATNVVNGYPTHPGNLSIIEDDPPPTITVTGTTVSESAGVANVTVQLSEPLTYSTAPLYLTEEGRATSPADFSGTPEANTPIIEAGTTTVTITIPIHNDTIAEGTESFDVSVAALDAGDLVTATVTILDDDGPPKRRTMRH